jgi:hypothetical protein
MIAAMTDAFGMPRQGGWQARGGWVVRALMREFGLTAEQAAGIVGNLGFESAGFTKLQEMSPLAGRGGYGWAQWTGPRRRAFEAWAEANELSPDSDQANYGFLVEELRTSHRQTIVTLRKCNSVEAAVWSVGQTYERPYGTDAVTLPGYEGRIVYAREALKGAAAVPATVADVQRRLNALGHTVTVDGIAGPQTCRAILDALTGT